MDIWFGGFYGGRPSWEKLLSRRVVGLDKMSAEKIEDVIMGEVLRGQN